MKLFATLVIGMALGSLGPAGRAAATTIVNGSFERGTDQPAPGSFRTLEVGNTDMTGWTVAQSNIDWGNNGFASDGTHGLDLNGNQGAGGVQQTLSTVAGGSYAVLFDMNANTDGGAVSLTVAAGGAARSYAYDPSQVPGQVWQTMEFDFIAAGASTELDFLSTTANQYYGPGLDNVRLAAPAVPEPDMVASFLVFGLGIAVARRRRNVSRRRSGPPRPPA